MYCSWGFEYLRYTLVADDHGGQAISASSVCFTQSRRKQPFLLSKGLGGMAWLLIMKLPFCWRTIAATAFWHHLCSLDLRGFYFCFGPPVCAPVLKHSHLILYNSFLMKLLPFTK